MNIVSTWDIMTPWKSTILGEVYTDFGFLKHMILYQEKNIDTGFIQTTTSGLGLKELTFIKMSSTISLFIKSYKIYLDLLLHYKSQAFSKLRL